MALRKSCKRIAIWWYGGVKLLPRLILKMNTGTVDMTTSISDKFKPMEQVSTLHST